MSRRRAAALAAVGLLVAGCGDGGSSPPATSAGSAAAETTTAATTVAVVAAGPPDLRPGPDGCDHSAPPAPRRRTYESPPASPLPPGRDATLVLYTSCGQIRVFLDRERGGAVTDAVAGLAADGYYDGLPFHRIVPGFVAQTGDPLGTGAGGPGFSVTLAPPSDYVYQRGDVAMAHRGGDPPGTSGSQLFVVLTRQGADQLTRLGPPASYAVIGHAQDEVSLKTIARLDALGYGDGPPVLPAYVWATDLVLEGG